MACVMFPWVRSELEGRAEAAQAELGKRHQRFGVVQATGSPDGCSAGAALEPPARRSGSVRCVRTSSVWVSGHLVESGSVEVFERAGSYENEGLLAKGWLTCAPSSHAG
jgi:hypothetical protein